MKPTGRSKQKLNDYQLAIVNDYLTSDMGYKEIAEKYNVNFSTLKYWVSKYRKDEETYRKEHQSTSLSDFASNSDVYNVIRKYKILQSLAYQKAIEKYNPKGINVENVDFDLCGMCVVVEYEEENNGLCMRRKRSYPIQEIYEDYRKEYELSMNTSDITLQFKKDLYLSYIQNERKGKYDKGLIRLMSLRYGLTVEQITSIIAECEESLSDEDKRLNLAMQCKSFAEEFGKMNDCSIVAIAFTSAYGCLWNFNPQNVTLNNNVLNKCRESLDFMKAQMPASSASNDGIRVIEEVIRYINDITEKFKSEYDTDKMPLF